MKYMILNWTRKNRTWRALRAITGFGLHLDDPKEAMKFDTEQEAKDCMNKHGMTGAGRQEWKIQKCH